MRLRDLKRSDMKRITLVLSLYKMLQAFLSGFFIFATRSVINNGFSQAWLVTLFAIAVFIPFTSMFMTRYAHRVTDRAVMQMRLRMLQNLERKDYGSVSGMHSGALVSRFMGDVPLRIQRYTQLMPDAIGFFFQLMVSIVLMAVISFRLTVAVIFLGFFVMCTGVLFRNILKQKHMVVAESRESVSSTLQESLESIGQLKAMNAISEMATNVEYKQDIWFKKRRRLIAYAEYGTAFYSTIMYVFTAVVVVWGARSHMPAGDLLALIQLVSLFRTPISGLAKLQSSVAALDSASERVKAIYRMPDEPSSKCDLSKVDKNAHIVFEHVTFRYKGEDNAVVSDFNAEVSFDRWTHITAPSGRGKSTLMRLVLGLFRPDSGRVFIRTSDGEEIPCGIQTRPLFAVVPQTPKLFSGSVRSNMQLVKPYATDEEILAAMRIACIEDIPLDTMLGDQGTGLSGGQTQRLCIARAVLSGRPFMLFDEITSSLDKKRSDEVAKNLKEHCPGALVATHGNVSGLCDQTIWIDEENA